MGRPFLMKTMETSHAIHFQSAANMHPVASNGAQLVVTSPPYPMIEMWDTPFGHQNPMVADALSNRRPWRAYELMHRQLDAVWDEVYRILAPGGIACINVGDATRTCNDRFALFPNHARILGRMVEVGFCPLPAVIWRKPTNAPNKFMGSGMLPPSAYVTLEHETILIVRKGDRRSFDTPEARQRRRQSAYFWEERNQWFSDVWLDVTGIPQKASDANQRSRSAAYPFEVPYRLISMFSVLGDTVVDPFAGTGTTQAAAIATARNSVGFEIDPGYQDAVTAQLLSAGEIATQHARRRLERHLAFVQQRIEAGHCLKHRNRHYGFAVMTSQETDLHLMQPLAIESAGPGRFKAKHTPAPLP